MSAPAETEKATLLSIEQPPAQYGSNGVGAPGAAQMSPLSRWLQWHSRSMLTMLVIVLCVDSGRGIVTPSLWPYLNSMGASKSFLGYVVAAPTAIRVIAAPLVGLLCNYFSYKSLLGASVLVYITGNLVYAFAPTPFFILLGRSIVGLSFTEIVVARTFVTDVTDVSERTDAFSELSAAQMLGIHASPLLSAALTFVDIMVGGYRINELNAAGLLMAVCGAACLLLLQLNFKEPERRSKLAAAEASPRSGLWALFEEVRSKKLLVSISACMFVDFASRFVFSCMETIVVLITEKRYGWGVFNNSVVLGLWGLVGFCSLFTLVYFSGRFNDLTVLWMSMVSMLLGTLLILDTGTLLLFHAGLFFIIGIGCPLAGALVVSVFSKLIEGLPQGTYQGMLAAMASTGRTCGAIWGGYGMQKSGEVTVVGGTSAVLVLSLLLMALTNASVERALKSK